MRIASALFILGCLLSIAGAQWREEASRAQLAPTPARVALEQMSQAERKNSRISVEFETSDSGAVLLGHEVERLWNGARYDEALVQLGNLETRVGHVAIGNSWRKPVPTFATSDWWPEVRIGNRDSLLGLAFDADYAAHLFVALRHSHGPEYYSVCTSSDYGRTWTETFTWVGSPVTLLDGAAVLDHFYVAYYSPGENAQQVRLRRFRNSDGSAVEFSTGDMWVAACTLDVGDTARELSLVCGGNPTQYITTLVSDGSVLLSRSDQDGVTWAKWSTGITSGASRGLAGAFDLAGTYVFWMSYLDTTDTLRIHYVSQSSHGQLSFALFCGTGALTSISAYSSKIICAYEVGQTSPPSVRYVSTSDAGVWSGGMLSDTGVAAEAPAVKVPYGGGFAAVFRQEDSTPELMFRQRTDSGPWSDPVSIADNEPYPIRPGIKDLGEYQGGEFFGVAYLSDTSPVVRGAYFDFGWTGGLAEQQRLIVDEDILSVFPNPLSGRGRLNYTLNHQADLRVRVYDRAGRVVRTLFDGHSAAGRQSLGFDATGMTPGVYFIRADAEGRALTVPVTVVR